MIVAVTGHRPDKLYGYDPSISDKRYEKLYRKIQEELRKLKPTAGITGMALGVDQMFARTCIEDAIPYTAALPCRDQESRWPLFSQTEYQRILRFAATVHHVHDGPYIQGCMQARNRWMVRRCDVLLAVWDGSKGGTGHCVSEAGRFDVPVIRIDPRAIKAE